MVKHPVDQFISWYYYERNGWQKIGVDPTENKKDKNYNLDFQSNNFFQAFRNRGCV